MRPDCCGMQSGQNHEHGGTRRELDLGGTAIEPLAPLFTATITTIYGGSNEIQHNIVSKAVLGL